VYKVAAVFGGLAALAALSVALFILSAITGDSMWASDPPSYPTLLPAENETSDAVQMRPGTFWEALWTFAVAAVVCGAIGWGFYTWAERRTYG
jgi:hypothetical protein